MATNQPTNAPVDQFLLYDNVATEIANTFNFLIEQLIARRDSFLTKLQTMKEDFVTKETTRRAAIEDLERVIQQMREEGIKENVNLKTQEKAIRMYRDQMERHQGPYSLNFLSQILRICLRIGSFLRICLRIDPILRIILRIIQYLSQILRINLSGIH